MKSAVTSGRSREATILDSLQKKVLLITGSLGSLGRSAVQMFLERGASLFCCDRLSVNEYPDIERLGKEYGEQRVVFHQADASEENEVIALIAALDSHYGRLDGVYHNVYTSVWKPAAELSLQEWESTIKGTMTSTFLISKYALPLMIRSGGGSIVNTSSVLGQILSPECSPYGTAKAGINHFTRAVAQDYGRYGIRANVLVPGDFNSREGLTRQSEKEKAAILRNTWMGRSGTVEEVNEVAAFLLSDASSYVTGALYNVDGGFHQ